MITTAIIEIIATSGLFFIILGELQLNKALINVIMRQFIFKRSGFFLYLNL